MKFDKKLKIFIFSLLFVLASAFEETNNNQESAILYSRYMSNLRNAKTTNEIELVTGQTVRHL